MAELSIPQELRTAASIHAQVGAINAPHCRVDVFAGPDDGHRAHVGSLNMLAEEASELLARIDMGESKVEGITPQIARHVLWHYATGLGCEPGSFTKNLLIAIATADAVNRGRLSVAYPGYVAACTLADRTNGGVTTLRAIATGGVS